MSDALLSGRAQLQYVHYGGIHCENSATTRCVCVCVCACVCTRRCVHACMCTGEYVHV